MGVYFIKKQGWRYQFRVKKVRYTSNWFPTKKEAIQAEAEKRKELKQPRQKTQTDITFIDLVNIRLDHIKTYNSQYHYEDSVVFARRWFREWGNLTCSELTRDMIEAFLMFRRKAVSAVMVNKEIRLLRALFNFGLTRTLIKDNPTQGIQFFPEERRLKYIPPVLNIIKVLAAADIDTRDYLEIIQGTLARVGEINALLWDDVDFEKRTITLYTRKKKGGHLSPRQVPMTNKVYDILTRRFLSKQKGKPWVFWHRYKSLKADKWVEGPYIKRNHLLARLCNKADVKRFGFHALRHSGASIMENNNVPIGAIQRILGHENRSTTEIYLQSFGNSEREAMKTFEKVTHKVTHK